MSDTDGPSKYGYISSGTAANGYLCSICGVWVYPWETHTHYYQPSVTVSGVTETILYCPYCGKKLPESTP